jgi:hypothetical protein
MTTYTAIAHVRTARARATRAKRSATPLAWQIATRDEPTAAPTATVRGLNDRLRQTFTGGRVVLSPGVLSLPPEANAEVLERVRTFAAFDPDNEELHDFGEFRFEGVAYCFELECCSRAQDGSKDPGDVGKTTRVMTVMRTDEY